jgi:carnitine 3-dehydrogenase
VIFGKLLQICVRVRSVFAAKKETQAPDRLTESSRDKIRMNLTFSTNLKESVTGVHFVQESGPERVDLKLFRDISNAVGKDVVIASSSSDILVSNFQTEATHPARIVRGHAFNSPHVVPLVEVVGGKLTSPENVTRAVKFYAQIGKKPIRMV